MTDYMSMTPLQFAAAAEARDGRNWISDVMHDADLGQAMIQGSAIYCAADTLESRRSALAWIGASFVNAEQAMREAVVAEWESDDEHEGVAFDVEKRGDIRPAPRTDWKGEAV